MPSERLALTGVPQGIAALRAEPGAHCRPVEGHRGFTLGAVATPVPSLKFGNGCVELQPADEFGQVDDLSHSEMAAMAAYDVDLIAVDEV